MTEARYANLFLDQPVQRVTTVGQQYGPPGGDNWTKLGSLSSDQMKSGQSEYVMSISGTIGNVLLVGSGSTRGLIQVCVGLASGLKFPHLSTFIDVNQVLSAEEGIPFNLLLFANSVEPDPVLGSFYDPSTQELCLWARSFTNGQAQTWYAEFDVCNVAWLWFDLTNIPAGESAMYSSDYAVSSSPLPPTNYDDRAPAAGNDGEEWLHFMAIRYRPGFHGGRAPAYHGFVMPDGSTWSSREVKLGFGGYSGMNRAQAVTGGNFIPTMNHGGWWTHSHTNSTTRAGFDFTELPSIAARSLLDNWKWFGVRIDTLPDVVQRVEQDDPGQGLPGGVRSVDSWQETYLAVERPRPDPGILTNPIVMVQQEVHWLNLVGAYGSVISEEQNSADVQSPRCVPQFRKMTLEGGVAQAYGRRQFMVGSPAMQYRIHAVGSSASPPGIQTLTSFRFLQFHPVRDPNNLTTPPAAILPAVTLSPGRQSPGPAALPVPPSAPESTSQSRQERDAAAIADAVGYRLSWPLGSRPVKILEVSWGPLSRADALAVLSFLQSSRFWRYTDERQVDHSAMTVSQPELTNIGNARATVSAVIALLTYVDP